MKLHTRRLAWGLGAVLTVALGTGCHKEPEATTPASATDTQQTDSRISAIQNDPRMSPADKQRAIDTLKSRSGGSAPH